MPPKVKCQVLIEPAAGATEDGKAPVRVMNLSERIRLNPRCRVVVLSKPQQVLTEDALEFEEEGALHVRRVANIQAVETSDNPLVPVRTGQCPIVLYPRFDSWLFPGSRE